MKKFWTRPITFSKLVEKFREKFPKLLDDVDYYERKLGHYLIIRLKNGKKIIFSYYDEDDYTLLKEEK